MPFLATLAAAVRDFYGDYEDDPGGSGYLRLELRAWVCGARGAEVVVGSGVVATAICPMYLTTWSNVPYDATSG